MSFEQFKVLVCTLNKMNKDVAEATEQAMGDGKKGAKRTTYRITTDL